MSLELDIFLNRGCRNEYDRLELRSARLIRSNTPIIETGSHSRLLSPDAWARCMTRHQLCFRQCSNCQLHIRILLYHSSLLSLHGLIETALHLLSRRHQHGRPISRTQPDKERDGPEPRPFGFNQICKDCQLCCGRVQSLWVGIGCDVFLHLSYLRI